MGEWWNVKAKTDGRRVVILGDPNSDPDHNCDAMGCNSVSHVIAYFYNKEFEENLWRDRRRHPSDAKPEGA